MKNQKSESQFAIGRGLWGVYLQKNQKSESEINVKWRTERDLNPRDPLRSAPLAGVWFQPLTHLSNKVKCDYTKK